MASRLTLKTGVRTVCTVTQGKKVGMDMDEEEFVVRMGSQSSDASSPLLSLR